MRTTLWRRARPILGLFLCGTAPLLAAPPPVAPDHSLTAAQYIALGLPADDRVWVGSDYATAAEVLKKVGAEDPTRLPRYASKTSGAVFRRLASDENLEIVRNQALTIGQRMPEALAMMSNLSQILLLYANATSSAQTFDAELVELTREILSAATEVSALARQFLVTLPADDPSREAREQGFEKLKQGLAAIVTGALTSLTEHDGYRTSELLRLAEAMETAVPTLLPQLPSGAQAEIPVRLHKMIAEEPDEALRGKLLRIEAALQALQKKGPTGP